MSKRIEFDIACPKCNNHYNTTLFRSIWGEYPDNRELVISDKINVGTCPNCSFSFKIPLPFIYTNAKQFFAVWWEPRYDPQIDEDSKGYSKMLGPDSYLATARRIQDWTEFKHTIIKFERGELKGQPPVIGKEMQDQFKGFVKHLENTASPKQGSGCMVVLLFFFSLTGLALYGAMKFFA